VEPADDSVGLWAGDRSWLLLCAGLALAATLTFAITHVRGEPALHALDWQPRHALTQPWRWWTAAWVHHSVAHLAVNLAGCAALAALGTAARLGRRWTMAWLLAWPLTHLGLLLQPTMAHYGGLSGVLHAGVAVATIALLTTPANHPSRQRRRRVGRLIGAGLLIKLVMERPWLVELQPAPWLGVAVAPLAHALGAAGGALAALGVAWQRARLRNRRSTITL
jgi:rhomboid family GlyGly-CTERM serine protease